MTRSVQRWIGLAVLFSAAPATADAPPSRYTFPSAGTVRDTKTQLTWQRYLPDTYPGCSGQFVTTNGTPGEGCTIPDATAYCAALTLDGGGWRLPTRADLLTLLDLTRKAPALDTAAFPGGVFLSNATRSLFWTSTPYVSLEGQPVPPKYWGIEFTYGYSGGYGMTMPGGVRCVR